MDAPFLVGSEQRPPLKNQVRWTSQLHGRGERAASLNSNEIVRAGAVKAVCPTPYALFATPQKNGSGPLITPETFLRHAWYCRKKPVGA